MGGDSAGGNISGNLALRAGLIGLPEVRVAGAILVHPYFGGVEVDDKMWLYMCPSASGIDDYRMKPSAEDLGGIGCDRMLVFVAEKDHLCGPGKAYYENLKKSGWKGKVELVENKGEEHYFHLRIISGDDNAVVKKIILFLSLIRIKWAPVLDDLVVRRINVAVFQDYSFVNLMKLWNYLTRLNDLGFM